MGTRRQVDLLVLDSAQTVTVGTRSTEDDIGVIDYGGVAIHDGRIVQVGSSQLLERKFSSNNIIRANDELILPGFVDPHTHLVFAGSREMEFQRRIEGATYLEILRKGGGILETVSKTRQASEEELLTTAQDRANTMLENGTSGIEVKSGYGLRLYDEMKILRVVSRMRKSVPCRFVSTFLGAHAVPAEYSQDEYTRVIIGEMLPEVRRSRLARFCDVFCENSAFNTRNSRKILRTAAGMGLRSKIHADQFRDSGGARLANEVRATSADHLCFSPLSELGKMEHKSVVPVVLPASSESLLSNTFAPTTEMLSQGLPVALGTDFSPSNWVLGQLTVAALAARRLKMRAEDILRGITLNAARAIGLSDEIGSLEPGKLADIVTLKAKNYKTIGYTYGEGLVDKVLIGGKLVVNEGRRVS